MSKHLYTTTPGRESDEPLAELDVFYSELTVNRAVVYARLALTVAATGATLRGRVRGPFCATAQTLPATAAMVDLGPGPTLLARAIVTDPSFWSPDLPAIYDVTVELCHGSNVVAQTTRRIGFRPLGVRGKWLVREEKPWVLRGVMTSSTDETDVTRWRDASAVLVDSSGEPFDFDTASRQGAAVFGAVPGDSPALDFRLRNFAAQPAGAILAVSAADGRENILSAAATNVILAHYQHSDRALDVPPWAKVVAVEATDAQSFAAMAAAIDRPVIAVRPLLQRRSVAQARAACDTLQRDLAPIGQFAGYIV